MREKWNKIRSKVIEWLTDVVTLVRENKRIAIIVGAFVIVIVGTIIITSVIGKKSQAATEVLSTEEGTEALEYPISEAPLEEDAYPDVNALMKKYYQAVADGDVDTIKSIKTGVDDKESIVIAKKSEYIESYPVVKCYTKKGPFTDSYLVFAYYEVKLVDFEQPAPGLNAWFVCKNDSGNLYIDDDEQDEKLANYCKILSVQDDVVDLNNTVNVKFNDLMAENEELAKFLNELPDKLTTQVGEELAKAEAATEEPTEEATETEEAKEETTVVKTVKATTVVNVRSSDSETADKVGKAQEGEEFKLLEEKLNGWSKIEFEGKEAYVKTEFLEVVSEEEVAADDADEADDASDDKKDDKKDDSKDTKSDSPTSGKATATDTIKLRKSASTDSEQLALIYAGSQVEVVKKQADGWSKIKYDGKTGYVKNEFLE